MYIYVYIYTHIYIYTYTYNYIQDYTRLYEHEAPNVDDFLNMLRIPMTCRVYFTISVGEIRPAEDSSSIDQLDSRPAGTSPYAICSPFFTCIWVIL